MKKLIFVALSAALLSACSSFKSNSLPNEMTLQKGITYSAEWVGKEPVIGRHKLTLVFADDGRVYGNAGCNHYFGRYQLTDNLLNIDQLGSTRMACAEPLIMQQEQRFMEHLSAVTRWDISKTDQLQLWPAEGAPMRFWPELD